MPREPSHTGRRGGPTLLIRARMYQGPLANSIAEIDRALCFQHFGRLSIRIKDPRDKTGFAIYSQTRSLPGHGAPERWMTVDAGGGWVYDTERYWSGDYEPNVDDLPWERDGAEGSPGGKFG